MSAEDRKAGEAMRERQKAREIEVLQSAAKSCDHGCVPWWDCEECRSTSHYGFSGDFR